MNEAVIWIVLFVSVMTLIISMLILLRSGGNQQGTSNHVRDELRTGREESRVAGRELREELARSLELAASTQQHKLDHLERQFTDVSKSNSDARIQIHETFNNFARQLQEANQKNLNDIKGTVQEKLEGLTLQFRELNESNTSSLMQVQRLLDARVRELQENNDKKLEEIRKTVDEKLHESLEKRLGDSFQLVSERLEAVHKGLGEMQSLATGVGDLKRVLSNVKVRGTWAEVQLGTILDEVLTPDQYRKNLAVKKNTNERVDFAIKLPGQKNDPGSHIWLPIDSKFPQEDYLRLQEASERADVAGIKAASDSLMNAVRSSAKDISAKYVDPPVTTDFCIMFLPTEGLYAEVLRHPNVAEEIRQKHRVLIAGPMTIVAILWSIKKGFDTLAIEQHASEAWHVLGAVKTEFKRFGETLDKVKKQLTAASNTIDQTDRRSRVIQKKLRSVEELPLGEARNLLGLTDGSLVDDLNDLDEVEIV